MDTLGRTLGRPRHRSGQPPPQPTMEGPARTKRGSQRSTPTLEAGKTTAFIPASAGGGACLQTLQVLGQTTQAMRKGAAPRTMTQHWGGWVGPQHRRTLPNCRAPLWWAARRPVRPGGTMVYAKMASRYTVLGSVPPAAVRARSTLTAPPAGRLPESRSGRGIWPTGTHADAVTFWWGRKLW